MEVLQRETSSTSVHVGEHFTPLLEVVDEDDDKAHISSDPPVIDILHVAPSSFSTIINERLHENEGVSHEVVSMDVYDDQENIDVDLPAHMIIPEVV